MKKRKLISLLLVALLSLATLSSCIGNDSSDGESGMLSFSDVFNLDYQNNVDSERFTSVADYTFLSDKQVFDNEKLYAAQLNTNVDPAIFTLYSIPLEKQVLSIEASKIANINDIKLETYYFTLYTEDENGNGKTTVYTTGGEVIHEAEGKYTPMRISDYILIGNSLYDTVSKDYSLEKICELPEIIDSDFAEMNFFAFDDAYIIYNETRYAYFDKEFKLISIYDKPKGVDDFDIALLGNGNLLIGTYELVPEDSEDFDFYDDGDKMKLTYFIFDYEDGITEEVDFGDYIIESLLSELIISDAFNNAFTDRVENIGMAYKIVNKTVDYSSPITLIVNNDGTVEGEVGVDGKKIYSASAWGEYFVGVNEFVTYIFDEDGDVLLEIPSNNLKFYEYGIYDKDTKKLYSFDGESLVLFKDFSKTYVIDSLENNYALYYEYSESGDEIYYFYTAEGGEKKISAPTGSTIYSMTEMLGDRVFVSEIHTYNQETDKTAKAYYYYNREGSLLFSSEYKYSYYRDYEGFTLIKASKDDVVVYKKLITAQPAVGE